MSAPKVLIEALEEASHAMTAAAFELARWAPNYSFNDWALQLSSTAILLRDDWLPAIKGELRDASLDRWGDAP